MLLTIGGMHLCRYNCKDRACVCHQQQPDLKRKETCHKMLVEWGRRMPSLQELARRAYQRAVPEAADYRATVTALPVGAMLHAFLLHDAELGGGVDNVVE